MSTELRRFWRLALSICAGLALVATALGTVGVLRGPTLTGATFDPERAAVTAETRLVLKSRQPLTEVAAGQVTVTPTAPFTVETKSNALTLRFTAPLAYGTDYTVTVAGVRGQYTGQAANWSYSFATPTATVYSLVAHRSDETTSDSVVTGEKGNQHQVLSAPGIEEYTATKNHVVAISHADDQSSELVVTRRPDDTQVSAQAPQVPALAVLRASWDGNRFGYTATGTDDLSGTTYDNTLFVQDDNDLGRAPMAISNGGQPLAVQDWQFVPGVAALVALSIEGQAYLIYLDTDAAAIALGSLTQLSGFLPGTTSLAAEAGGKEVLIDLADGTRSSISPAADVSSDNLAGRRALLGTDAYVGEYYQLEDFGGRQRITTRLVHVTGSNRTVLVEQTPEQGEVLDSGVSRNGEFAWVVVLDPEAPADDLTSGASDHASTLVYDLASGKQVASLPGSTPVWAAN